MLPALAELYGVSADDILAGETLTDRRRSALEGETAAQRKRLLARLRMRFDICLLIALALALGGLAVQRMQYVSRIMLLVSVVMVWGGYILVAHPIRYGGVEADPALWKNLYRKLLAAGAVQWYVLLRILWWSIDGLSNFGYLDGIILASRSAFFFLGVFLIWCVLQWWLRRLAGKDVWIIPLWLALWGTWALLFLSVWLVADLSYHWVLADWLERYPSWEWIDQYAALCRRRDETFAPLLLARRIVLAAGGVSGLGLLGWTAWSVLRRKKLPAPLADPQK